MRSLFQNLMPARLKNFPSELFPLFIINIGNFAPAIIGLVVLPIYLSRMGEDYSVLSFGLAILSTAYILEGGVTRVTALQIQSLISSQVTAKQKLADEINSGLFYVNLIFATISPIAALVNYYFFDFSLLIVCGFCLYFYSLSIASLLRGFLEVTGKFRDHAVSKILYIVMLNIFILSLVFVYRVSFEAIVISGLAAKLIEVIFLITITPIKLEIKLISYGEVKKMGPKIVSNFIANFAGSGFFLIDKVVVLGALTASSASIYMGWQDIALKYAIFLSSFSTLFLKNADDSFKKRRFMMVMLSLHLTFVSIFSLAFWSLDVSVGVLSKHNLIMFVIFSSGVICNALAALELIQLQRRNKYNGIMIIQVAELLVFTTVLMLVRANVDELILALIWSIRMVIDLLLLKLWARA